MSMSSYHDRMINSSGVLIGTHVPAPSFSLVADGLSHALNNDNMAMLMSKYVYLCFLDHGIGNFVICINEKKH